MTNRKSNEIEIELNQTTERLDELIEMRKGINDNVKALQQGFIDRKTSLDELQTEQGKLTILNDSVKSLEAKQGELHDAFQRASLFESRCNQIEKAKAIALEADNAYSDYLKYRFELNESLKILGRKMVDSFSKFVNKQFETKNAMTAVEPHILFSELGLPKVITDSVSGAARSLPMLEFGDTVQLVENRITDERQGEARMKRETEQAAKAVSK